MNVRSSVGVVATVAVIGALATAASSVHAHGVGSGLFGRVFVSSQAVVKNGDRVALAEGTRIRVKFARGDGQDVVRWRSGCNHFGAPVEITATHLEIGEITGTYMGCANRLLRQDRWVTRFFESDPGWLRHGRKLRLTRGDDRIRLRRPAR